MHDLGRSPVSRFRKGRPKLSQLYSRKEDSMNCTISSISFTYLRSNMSHFHVGHGCVALGCNKDLCDCFTPSRNFSQIGNKYTAHHISIMEYSDKEAFEMRLIEFLFLRKSILAIHLSFWTFLAILEAVS